MQGAGVFYDPVAYKEGLHIVRATSLFLATLVFQTHCSP